MANTLEQLNGTLTQNGEAAQNPAVKVSVSYGSSKQVSKTETESQTHTKSLLSAGRLLMTADAGKAELIGTDLEAKQAVINARDGILSQGVMDSYQSHTKTKNQSASVGVFVGFNGNSYGIGAEGTASVGKGKTNIENQTWQNNHWNIGSLTTNSEKGGLTLDATTVNAEQWQGELNSLTLKSRQDTEKYLSENKQASVSGSVAYGSGGGASASLGYQSAKLDTAQVNEQTGIHVGKEGMDVTVKGHTQLDGAVITSEADKAKNHFSTQSIASQDIENHSELKTRSVSVSGGTSGFNPMSALSLLGNKNEESHSTTKSAIGDNIQLETPDTNAENINRNTQNTNNKVTKQDLAKAQDVQESVGVVGEISNNLINIYTHKEREEIEQAKLALGKAKSQSASEDEIGKLSAELDRLQRQYDENYGTGSATKQAIDAVTATLQGLVAKDLSQAAVGLASPYLNEQIKHYTQNADGSTNQTTNLLAHALLGAVEAQVTGNNALAGAAAGAGGEAAAMYLTKALYNKDANQLTEDEKKNIVLLSQVASGLAAGVTGDSTQSAVIGTDIGKRAVENNLLSLKDDEYVYQKNKEFEEKGYLSEKDKQGTKERLLKDIYINHLIQKYQKDPNSLSYIEQNYLNVELPQIAKSYGISVESLYNWDFSNIIKRDDSALSKYLVADDKFWNQSYEGRQAKSFAVGVAALPLVYGGDKLIRFYPELAQGVAANPVLSETAVAVGYKSGKLVGEGQVFVNGNFNQAGVEDIFKDGLKTLVLGKLPFRQQIGYGIAIDYGYEVNKYRSTDESIKTEMLGVATGSSVNMAIEGISSKNPVLNGMGKIFSNTILSDQASDKAKEIYQNYKSDKGAK